MYTRITRFAYAKTHASAARKSVHCKRNQISIGDGDTARDGAASGVTLPCARHGTLPNRIPI